MNIKLDIERTLGGSVSSAAKVETGTTGAAGANILSNTIIPFASQKAPYVTRVNGVATTVAPIGSGYAPHDALTLNSNGSFSLSSKPNHQIAFSLPFDTIIREIYITAGNYAPFSPSYAVYPYITLYSASPDSNLFTPIADTTTIPTTGLGPGSVPAGTMVSGSATGLNIELPAGTRIVIGGMVQEPGSSGIASYYLYFTGGVGISTRY